MDRRPLVVFTDLDGTLLDHATYSFGPARPALDALAAAGVPVVLCTSKTRAGPSTGDRPSRHAPFVVENGGAVSSEGHGPARDMTGRRRLRRHRIWPALRRARRASPPSAPHRAPLRGRRHGPHEIAVERLFARGGRACGRREYDEPPTGPTERSGCGRPRRGRSWPTPSRRFHHSPAVSTRAPPALRSLCQRPRTGLNGRARRQPQRFSAAPSPSRPQARRPPLTASSRLALSSLRPVPKVARSHPP
jgi:hypothetical protein